jgi:hypothetical protein
MEGEALTSESVCQHETNLAGLHSMRPFGLSSGKETDTKDEQITYDFSVLN